MKITYEDHMGDDLKVVNMARVSFSKKSECIKITDGYIQRKSFDISHGEETWEEPIYKKTLMEKDKKLIEFLARGCTSGDWEQLRTDIQTRKFFTEGDIDSLIYSIKNMPTHWTPFAHCQTTLHVKVPIFVSRQLDKHQVGFVKSEVSRRYVDSEPEYFVPDVWRKRAADKKQGSEGEITNMHTKMLPTWHEDASQYYNFLLRSGVAPEQARMVLPQSMYTEYFMTGSLYGWANLFNQRSRPDAQKEIQEVARQISNIMERLYPISWEALTRE